MINQQVQFVCPSCGEERLVEVREQIKLKSEVTGVFVIKDPSTNRTKCYLEQGDECGRTDGKITGFRCDACGFMPMTLPQIGSRLKPITTQRGLYFWLKRNKMIIQDERASVETVVKIIDNL